jgi:hypothetical protein
MLLYIARMTGMCHHTQLFSNEMGFTNFFAQADLNYNLPDLSLRVSEMIGTHHHSQPLVGMRSM